MQQDKKSINLKQNIKGGITGSLIFIIETVLSVTIAMKSFVTSKMYLPILIICILISGFVSGFCGTIKVKKNGIYNGLISSLLPSVFVFSAICIASKSINIGNILSIFVILFGGLTGGIVAVNIKRNKKIKR